MNTLKKMFLLTTIVLLLVGFTAVSAADSDDVTNDAVYSDATAYGVESNEQINEGVMLSYSSSEDDIQPGATTTNPEEVVAVADDAANISATVDRVIPGARLSEGVVDFNVNDGEITVVNVPLIDGIAITEIHIPEEWVGQNITYTASFLGSQNFLPSSGESTIHVVREMYDTSTTIDPVIGEFYEPITLTANVKSSVDGPVDGGFVFFTTETGDIRDEDGSVIYVPVVNSIATVETTALPSWKDDGDVNTIYATYTGYDIFAGSESEPTALRIYEKIYNTSTAMVPPKGVYDQPINLTAAVVTEDLEAVDFGEVYFVIGDRPVTDEEGNVLYASVIGGVANVETIASRDWHDGGDVFTIHAVYEGVGEYLDSVSEDVGITLVERFYNTTTTIGPVIGEFDKPITITANVKTPLLGSLNSGEVYFVTATGAIKDEEGYIQYAPVINGVATLETIAQRSWLDDGDVNTIEAKFDGFNEFLPSTSEPTALRLYDKIFNTTTTMVPPEGVYGEPIHLIATVDDENGDIVDVGYVYYVIGDKIVTDQNGNVLYGVPYEGYFVAETIADKSWHDGGDVFTIYAVYEGVGEYLDSESEPVGLYIDDPVNPPYKPVKPVTPVITKQVTKTFKDTKKADKTFTVLVKDKVVTTGNVITLKDLNNIFNKDFTNGILVVYLDGKVVFNGTTTDDLTLVILEIIASLIGEHELKVEFTDSNNETNSYVESITIK